MRQARMKDGTTVELTKDCECLDSIHEGPHWLHTDKLWKDSIDRMMDRGNFSGVPYEQTARIAEKIRQMEQRGIDELVANGTVENA